MHTVRRHDWLWLCEGDVRPENMTDWSEAGSDPLADIRKGIASVYARAGIEPFVMIMSAKQKQEYEAAIARYERLLTELTEATNFVAKYKIRRELGHSRTRIFLPKLYRWWHYGWFWREVRIPYMDWKRRNELYYEPSEPTILARVFSALPMR